MISIAQAIKKARRIVVVVVLLVAAIYFGILAIAVFAMAIIRTLEFIF